MEVFAAMHGHHGGAAVGVPEIGVASTLTNQFKPKTPENSCHLGR